MKCPAHSAVGPEYFDDGDRDDAAAIAAELVNTFASYDIQLSGIGLQQVCDRCTVMDDAYVISLGVLRLDEAREVIVKLKDMTDEFSKLHDHLMALTDSKGPNEPQA
ncbi:hypothetical protein G3I29_14300 [Streptomyces halstedii]|uniref:Uncharacterized protein n=2 Tax=Streptomyces halstedii TaxID=1944 RepID=A0A6N9TZ49_STRHA|nr:hypothetical protein [Streptomyces halstedii]